MLRKSFIALAIAGLAACVPTVAPTAVASVSVTGEIGAPIASNTTLSYAAPAHNVRAGEYVVDSSGPASSFAQIAITVDEPLAQIAYQDYYPTFAPFSIVIRREGAADMGLGTVVQVGTGTPSYRFVVSQKATPTAPSVDCVAVSGTIRTSNWAANLTTQTSPTVTQYFGPLSKLTLDFDVQCAILGSSATKNLKGTVEIHP